MTAPLLSVVVPTLDEAEALPALMADLRAQRGLSLEIVVADGGSGDGTPGLACAAGARLVSARRGRGAQMNAGAEVARGDWLLFLHADTRPMAGDQLRRAVDSLRACGRPRVAGHFPLRFDRARHGHDFLFRLMEAKSATNRRYAINGDQGLLIHRDWFRALGGFDESLSFLEDQRIAARIHDHGEWRLLPGRLRTSARRFETEGPERRYLLMAIIMAMYVLDMLEFFERAPGVYRAQGQAERLLLTPYFRLLRRLMRELGPVESARRWYRVGGFVVEQAWQAPLALDLWLQRYLRRRQPFSALAAHLPGHLLANPVARAGGGLLAFAVSQLALAPWCRWRERQALRRGGPAAPTRSDR